jgi:lysozyme
MPRVNEPPRILPMEQPATGKGRLVAIAGTTAAAALLGLLAPWEGKRNDPYRDIVGVWTVCYGETRVEMRSYTDAECEDMLATGAGDFAEGVLKATPNLKDRPYQLAAASSLAYNIGLGNYRNSTAARRFRIGDYAGGCAAMLRWNRAGGKVVRGLVNRRQSEYRVCMTDLPKPEGEGE